ncbi:hypothetical protein THOM_2871 [Trachipleistophora hominis]|uniref:Mediator of RNA polymerase II transcription subunit 22 n=1 Tax=Trachipleistophora hominis TaxID=72359 RepID=L7JSF9_TRAHO|nr:hypothetical protein THOM_2871 [Trachipleistophora hominis]
MDNKTELIRKINTSIEKIFDTLIDIFTMLSTTNTQDYKELRDIICIQRKIVQVSDTVLQIYNYTVLLKYMRYEKGVKKDEHDTFDADAMFNSIVDEIMKG